MTYAALQQESETLEQRTPKSAESHRSSLKSIPLGVASNYARMTHIPFLSKKPAARISAISMAKTISITTTVSEQSWRDLVTRRS